MKNMPAARFLIYVVAFALAQSSCISSHRNDGASPTAVSPDHHSDHARSPSASDVTPPYSTHSPTISMQTDSFQDDDLELTAVWPPGPAHMPASISGDSPTSDLSKDYQAGQTFVSIREPLWLEKFENAGFSFSEQIGSGSELDTQTLYKENSLYKSLVDTTEGDLSDIRQREGAVKGSAPVGVGMKFQRRLLDINWLKSQFSRFELVGVINRIDRASFNPDSCGELRFIYRLAYQTKNVYSRLPVTLLVKYDYHGSARQWEQCRDIANRWKFPTGLTNDAQVSNWILGDGPLARSDFDFGKFCTVEFNTQALRIPSAARPQLAGEGTYLMRVFKRAGDILVPDYLENTPDVERLNQDPALKAGFVAQFKDRHFMHRLADGILLLDNQYLAKRAISYSPYGISRQENRPFDRFLKESDFAGAAFEAGGFVPNASSALKRLNDLSCIGCHQGRAHAGFHFLGIDKPSTHPFNALFFEGSGHFETELRRRLTYTLKTQSGSIPDPKRDFSLAPPNGEFAGRGNFCGLPGSAFTRWQCAPGLTCHGLDSAVDEKDLGKCLPQINISGDPTTYGSVTQDRHQADSLKVDHMMTCSTPDQRSNYGTYSIAGGFPAGICFKRNCDGLKANVGDEVCSQAAGPGFNQCLTHTGGNGNETFTDCLEKTAIHNGFARCSQEHACRNDYVCSRNSQNEGFCTPSYFLFQIRVDGHPDPVSGI